jgi:hypothetical protein
MTLRRVELLSGFDRIGKRMNSFEKVIRALGLNSDSQGEAGWLYALCQYGAGDYEGADTFAANPAKEVYARLAARNVGPHTLVKVRGMLNTLEGEYESRRAA